MPKRLLKRRFALRMRPRRSGSTCSCKCALSGTTKSAPATPMAKRAPRKIAFVIRFARQQGAADQAARSNRDQPDFHLMGGHACDQETAADDAQAQRSRIDTGMG